MSVFFMCAYFEYFCLVDWIFFFFEIRTCCKPLASLVLAIYPRLNLLIAIPLPQLPRCWDCRCVTPYLVRAIPVLTKNGTTELQTFMVTTRRPDG